MIVRKFMQWAAGAAAAERAEGAGALARAFLYSGMDQMERRDAQLALTSLLDDHSPLVRKALSDVFAASPDAPHAIIVALANDQSDIAAPVLARSPLLRDAQLIDCAAIGDAFAQAAIAIRPTVSASVSAALAEVAVREALVSLAVNPGADIPEFSARRMVARFGHDADIRRSLLSRPDLPPSVRSDLVVATAKVLAAFVGERGWLSSARTERVVKESCDRAHVMIAADVERDSDLAGARALAAHLRESAQLTPSLILRAILSGNYCLLDAALVELSELPERKALGLARQRNGQGFATIYRHAGLPEKLLPAFQAALAARDDFATASDQSAARLSRAMIERVLTACEQINGGELNALMSLLRRFETEAAREEARDAAAEMSAPTASMFAGDEPFMPDFALASNVRAIDIDLAAIEAELIAA